MTLCVPISPAGLLHGHIDPVLRHLATYHNAMATDDARVMLLRVAAAESELMWLEQHNGPARSYWQIEPPSAQDAVFRAPRKLQELLFKVSGLVPYHEPQRRVATMMTWNPWAACAIARAYWWVRDPDPMPPWQDAPAQAERWKAIYNTHLGAGTPEGFLAKCEETGVEDFIAQTFGGTV